MQAIKQLENISEIIPHDKGSVLLVHAGLKPSALFAVEGEVFQDKDSVVHVLPKLIETIQTVLFDLALTHVMTIEIMDAHEEGSFVEVLRFFIAQDPSAAEKLKQLFDGVSANHKEIGELLGYPQTAIDVFLTDEMLEQSDVPESTEEVSELNMRLLGHRLSKAHWREEVKYLEESGNYIKSVSPAIYDAITQENEAY